MFVEYSSYWAFFGFLGLIPIPQETLFFKFYPLGLTVVMNSVFIYFFYCLIMHFNIKVFTLFSLDAVLLLSDVFLLNSCLLNGYLKRVEWKKFLLKANILQQTFQTRLRKTKKYAVATLCLYMLAMCLDVSLWINLNRPIPFTNFMKYRFIRIYKILMDFMIQGFAELLESSYRELNFRLKNIHKSNNRETIIKIYNINSLNRDLFEVIQTFNSVLGWPIFLGLSGTLLQQLKTLCFLSLNVGKHFVYMDIGYFILEYVSIIFQ